MISGEGSFVVRSRWLGAGLALVASALALAGCSASGGHPGTVGPTSAAPAVVAGVTSSSVPSVATTTASSSPAPTAKSGVVVTPAGVVLPDPHRTPGATNAAVTAATIHSTICVSGWTATVRPPASYTTRLKVQQLATGYAYHGDRNTADYEEDHLISLELGGSPTSPKNLWPEPYAASGGARVKDRIENKLHSLVCAGRLGLATAQRAIATNWYRAYVTYLGTPSATSSTPRAAPPPRPTATSAAPRPAALSCTASMSNAGPHQYSTTDVIVHTAAGAAVTATAHYKSTDTSHSATAAGNGTAELPFAISRATIGFRVAVDVTVTAHGAHASCATAFTPQ